MKKIIVTGSSGLIGSEVVSFFAEKNWVLETSGGKPIEEEKIFTNKSFPRVVRENGFRGSFGLEEEKDLRGFKNE